MTLTVIPTTPATNPAYPFWKRALFCLAERRPPDFCVGSREDPYLRRWWVIPRNPFLNVYLHHFCRPDDDRALHDHPWWSLSLCLKGVMEEHLSRGRVRRIGYGRWSWRWARTAHRIDLMLVAQPRAGHSPDQWRRTQEAWSWDLGPHGHLSAWTLFITGPRFRSWGFHCPQGWRHWKKFTAPGRKGEVGRGCA